MIFLFNYLKLIAWSTIYYLNDYKSPILTKILIKNIREAGCVPIKFCQWVLPQLEVVYDIEISDFNSLLYSGLEELYENCDHHSIEFTKDKYLEAFGNDIDEDYDVKEVIASGSIGQVYRVVSKYDGKNYALKSIHPSVIYQIFFIQILFKFIYKIPILNQLLIKYIPINLNGFIEDFKTQTDLINEANNCLFFNNNYRNNKLIIIPKIVKVSKNIMVMSYEEGEQIDDMDISDYKKYKIAMYMRLFVKSNEQVYNTIHGDLHKGNWKVRLVDGKPKLVIYDFGFCWKVPFHLRDHLDYINETFLCLSDDNEENIIEACYLFINKCCDKNSIKDAICETKKISKLSDTDFIMRLIINTVKNDLIIIDPFIIQSVIIHSQILRLLERFSFIKYPKEEDDTMFTLKEYYNRRVPDVINLCKTENAFMEYCNFLEKVYESKDIKTEELFKYSCIENNLCENETLKNLAIEGITFS